MNACFAGFCWKPVLKPVPLVSILFAAACLLGEASLAESADFPAVEQLPSRPSCPIL